MRHERRSTRGPVSVERHQPRGEISACRGGGAGAGACGAPDAGAAELGVTEAGTLGLTFAVCAAGGEASGFDEDDAGNTSHAPTPHTVRPARAQSQNEDLPRDARSSRSHAMHVPSGRRTRPCVLQVRARALVVSVHVGCVRFPGDWLGFLSTAGEAGAAPDVLASFGRGASDAYGARSEGARGGSEPGGGVLEPDMGERAARGGGRGRITLNFWTPSRQGLGGRLWQLG